MITGTYDYDAFGNLLASTGSTSNNYRFAGEQFDPALGIYYNRARYYDERNGRFWSIDTLGGTDDNPATLHKYVFGGNEPVDQADPSGRDFDLATTVAGLDVGNTLANMSTLQGFANAVGPISFDVLLQDANNDSGLRFPYGTDIGGPIDAQGRGWYWNVELKAKFVPGANTSQYSIRQRVVRSDTTGQAFVGDRLRSFKYKQHNKPDNPDVTARSGNGIYAPDSPGPNNHFQMGGQDAFVDSVTSELHFESWIEKTGSKNHLLPKKWYVKIVVDPGLQLNKDACSAGLE